MSVINREALYEKACDLEAQALAYVGKIANDETKIEEWKIWSAILAERTAFKHDIFDAPSVQPERKTGKWAVGESVFFAGKMHHMPITCSCCGRSALNEPWKFCPNCGAKMDGDIG